MKEFRLRLLKDRHQRRLEEKKTDEIFDYSPALEPLIPESELPVADLNALEEETLRHEFPFKLR